MIEPMDHQRRAIPSPLASWVVVLGMATGVTGCTSLESSGGTRTVETATSYQWLKKEPANKVMDGTQMASLSPTESVKHGINDMLFILGDEALREPGLGQERRQQIEQVIRHHVNIEQMAQRSLGAPWSTLSVPERQEFVSLFVELIRDLVANKIDQYYDEQVFYFLEQREGNFAEVRTHLIGTKVNTSVDFRLEHHSGDWLVYDVVIDGACIVANYRTQFDRISRDHAHAGLVGKMKQRAFTVKLFEKTTPVPAILTMDTDSSR